MSKNEPAYQEIASEIRKTIQAGELSAGEKAPSISSLAKKHEVNRSTVKRAYDALIDEGYVLAIQGKGFFVTTREEASSEPPTEHRVFWSYAHKDDRLSYGAITQLRESIQAEYELQTGNEANIFQDTKDIKWGMDWRRAINASLGVVTFFIPILTPTYLKSPHCLSELRTVINRFKEIGFDEGIYPIEFVDCTKAIELLHDDDLARVLANRQRLQNWIDLRLENPSTEAYRKGVHEIVRYLLKREQSWERTVTQLEQKEAESFEDEEGPLERVAIIEDALEGLTVTVQDIGKDLTDIGNAFAETQILANATPRQTLALAGRVAHKLESPSENLKGHCEQYDKQMQQIDRGIDGIIELNQILTSESFGNTDDMNLDKLRDQVTGLLKTTEQPFEQIESLRVVLRDFSRLAHILRKPCQKIDVALNDIVSSKLIMESWNHKLEDVVN